MQLRSGKRTDGTCCRNHPKMAVVPRSNTVTISMSYRMSDKERMNRFIKNINTMLQVMEETEGKPRIALLIDIYDYIQTKYKKIKHIDQLQNFFETVAGKTIDNLTELPKMVEKYHDDEETIANIKKLNQRLIEMYVMLNRK